MDPLDRGKSGDPSASNAQGRLNLDGKWRQYLEDLLVEAFEKICHNRLEATTKAQSLLRANFAPNPLRLPKLSRFPPRIPRARGGPRFPLPRKLPRQLVIGGGAVGTGFLSLLYHFMKKIFGNVIEFCRRWAKVMLIAIIAYTAIKVLQNMRRGMAVLIEQIPERVFLIVCDDTLAHGQSRKALLHILDNPSFFAVIPTCVMEGILYGMESVDVMKSSKAHSTFLVIFDLLRLGKAHIEKAPVPENSEDVEWGWESSEEERQLLPGYEDRIIQCAQDEQGRNPNALALIITNSEQIRTRAVRTGLRCEIPPVVLNWSRN